MEIQRPPTGLRGHVAGLLFPLTALGLLLALGARQPVDEQQARLAAADLPVLALHLKFEDQQRLAYKRKEALARGLLFAESDDFVPATAVWGGAEYKTKVRLKGDLVDHLQDEEGWSLRVRLRGGDTLAGMSTFSLHRPSLRMGAAEWLYTEILRAQGFIAPRYDFVRVELNGRALGVYAREESFSKHLVEAHHRREGPVVRFNEQAFWAELATQVRPEQLRAQTEVLDEAFRNAGADWAVALVDGFGEGQTRKDPVLWARWVEAVQSLGAFRDGTRPLDQVFDVPRTARFVALTEVLNGYHALMWHNARFYADPVTGRLEPIGFDAEAETWVPTLPLIARLDDERDGTPRWVQRLLADEVFAEQWMAALRQYVEPGVLEGWLQELGPQMDAIEAAIGGPPVDRAMLLRRRDLVRGMISPAYVAVAHQGADPQVVSVAATGAVPLRVVAAGCAEAELAVAPVALTGRTRHQPLVFADVPLPALGDCPRAVVVQLLGSADRRRIGVHPWSPSPSDAAAAAARSPRAEQLPDFVRRVADGFEVAPGRHRADRDIVVPAGGVLRLAPGAQIDLVHGASLLSHAPLQARGRPDAPIAVRSSDGTGGGVLVFGGASALEHVLFAGLGVPAGPGPGLTGAVTFHTGAVSMRHVVFEDARAEDSLNLVRTEYDLESVRFLGGASDSLDIDFGGGRLAKLRFEACGNDCLDVSGTELQLDGLTVIGAGDKGVSVGEASRVRATSISVTGAPIGVAVKDLSELRVSGLSIADARYGIAAYRKKPEFGPGLLDGTDVALSNVERSHLVDAGSRVSLDGQMVAPTGEGVAEAVEASAQ